MATSKLLRVKEEDLNTDDDISSCDACASTEIKKTREGYVCSSCG